MRTEEYLIKTIALHFGEDKTRNGLAIRDFDCNKAQLVVFALMKRLEEKGIKLKIPWYWDSHGPRLELNTLLDMYPNLIWSCSEEEYMRCPYQTDCDFRNKWSGKPWKISSK